MDPIDQLAAERRLEHKIEGACMRIIQDLEDISNKSYVTTNDIETFTSISTYLKYAEAYILNARLLLTQIRGNTLK